VEWHQILVKCSLKRASSSSLSLSPSCFIKSCPESLHSHLIVPVHFYQASSPVKRRQRLHHHHHPTRAIEFNPPAAPSTAPGAAFSLLTHESTRDDLSVLRQKNIALLLVQSSASSASVKSARCCSLHLGCIRVNWYSLLFFKLVR
jgi:hypothetical protein